MSVYMCLLNLYWIMVCGNVIFVLSDVTCPVNMTASIFVPQTPHYLTKFSWLDAGCIKGAMSRYFESFSVPCKINNLQRVGNHKILVC